MNDSITLHHIPSDESRRRARRRRREGMTLIEIMIVVVIMAMIATAVGIAVLPALQGAKEDSTRTDAQTIRSAATLYLLDHNDCPTTQKLVEARVLDSSKRTTDAWDNDFQISCEGGDISVVSGGVDGQVGTEDDIR